MVSNVINKFTDALKHLIFKWQYVSGQTANSTENRKLLVKEEAGISALLKERLSAGSKPWTSGVGSSPFVIYI
ncbi:hypothetical protein PRUPE_1G087200 [Prunus persica]|uniref:Uncharacterized protein n=1 Tax=Prunus persica TaxID=3760 RepID=M5XSR2_PRUPE|nr:hypothetical protein PRUPE_1G087200 [Prunus persica]